MSVTWFDVFKAG